MTTEELKKLVQDVVKQAYELKNKYTKEKNAPVNYSAIFSQSEDEYHNLYESARQVGKVIQNTPTGDLFDIGEIGTVAGKLRLLKIRKPDATRPERGDADFTAANYTNLKDNLNKPGFKLIERENFEMIELTDPEFNVRAYFSNPPLDKQLGL